MTTTPPIADAEAINPPLSQGNWARTLRRRRALLAGAVVAVLVAGGVVVVVMDPFASPAKAASSSTGDNAYPISYTTVQRRSLSSQTEVQGTLGYASGSNDATATNVVLPTGTATSALTQAKQQVKSAQQALAADTAGLQTAGQSNTEAVTQAQALVTSAQRALAADRAGLQTAGQSNTEAVTQAQALVTSARQALAADRATVKTTNQSNTQALDQARQSVTTAKTAEAHDQSVLKADQATLSADEQKEAADCQGTGAAEASGGSPAGTSPSACAADKSQVSADQAAVTADQSRVTSDEAALTAAQQAVAATKTHDTTTAQQAQTKVTSDEAALTAAQQAVAATKTHDTTTAQQAQAKVTADEAALTAAQEGVAATKTHDTQTAQQAQAKVTADEAALTAAQGSVAATKTHDTTTAQQATALFDAAKLALTQDEANLATDEASSSVAGQTSTYTALPSVGQVIRRGQSLFDISGQPVSLLYGGANPWRAFMPGMSPGPDVAELNSNLAALGFGHNLGGDNFSSATEVAVKSFQSAHGLAATGQLPLGSVLFEPAPVQVTAVTPSVGSTVTPGLAVLQVTLTARQVQIALDVSQQSDLAVGDKVSIVMPDNSTTPGVVSYVSTVAVTPSSATGSPGSPTVTVDVTPLDPAATGKLDQLPVNVWITTGSVANAYVVPVDALVALANGGYALEAVGAGGTHQLVAVSLGLFDDADGLVQVSGAVHGGERLVVPGV